MRIVIDLTSLNDNFSGIERYALNMTLELIRQEKEAVFELIFKNEVFPAFSAWEGKQNIKFHILRGYGKLRFNQWQLPRYLNRLKADYYLFFAFPMPVLLHRKHVLGTIHDVGCWDCPETMKKQMAWYFCLSNWWMAKRAERIITISEFSKSRIQKILKVPDSKILVAYCGLSEQFQQTVNPAPETINEVRSKYNLPETYYLCLSTLEPRKNMMFLLDAYLELYRHGLITTKLVLAGRKGWKIDGLLEAVNMSGDSPVTVTGFIDDEDLPVIYRQARCFIFPSIYEGFGIPPLEAMSQGVPVISSDASSMREVLGDAAIYFKNRDADSLKKAMLYVEKNNALADRIEKGINRSRLFRYEKEAGKLLKCLQRDIG